MDSKKHPEVFERKTWVYEVRTHVYMNHLTSEEQVNLGISNTLRKETVFTNNDFRRKKDFSFMVVDETKEKVKELPRKR